MTENKLKRTTIINYTYYLDNINDINDFNYDNIMFHTKPPL